MQIQFAALLAVLLASAASAADFAFYVGPDCHGQRFEQVEVGTSHYGRKKMIPDGAKSFTISKIGRKDPVRVFERGECGKPDDPKVPTTPPIATFDTKGCYNREYNMGCYAVFYQ